MKVIHGINMDKFEYYILWTVHLGIILVNDKLDAQFFFLYVYFNFLHVSSNLVLIIRRINCINTSGMYHCVGIRQVCRSGTNFLPDQQTVTYTDWHIPDVVLIQLILLMMSTRLLETCKKGKSSRVTVLEWPRGFQEATVPRFLDNGTGWW
jgi:hypothetical protein